MSKLLKILGGTIITLVLVAALVLVGISVYVGDQMTTPVREGLTYTPKTLGIKYENVSFKSTEDIDLQGWWMPHPNPQATVVFVHGYGRNREQRDMSLKLLLPDLHDRGFNVLMFDLRASGLSEGKRVTIGVKEQDDVKAAIEFAKSKSNAPVILHGISMGAATVLSVSDEVDVSAIIADSPFSDLEDYLSTNLSTWSDLPNFPFTPIIVTVTPWFTGLDPGLVRPIEDVKKAKMPILLIHSKGDDAIPVSESEKLAEANKDIIFVPTDNDGHLQSLKEHEELYKETMFGFIEEVLL